MKLWTCFSARVNSNFLESSATRKAVQPAPYVKAFLERRKTERREKEKFFASEIEFKNSKLWKLWNLHHLSPFFVLLFLVSLLILVERDCITLSLKICCVKLTMIPVLTAMPRPQYVFGTISPKPTLKNVIAMSHMEFKRLACSSSWNLNMSFGGIANYFQNQFSQSKVDDKWIHEIMTLISFFLFWRKMWRSKSFRFSFFNLISCVLYEFDSDRIWFVIVYSPPFRMSELYHVRNKYLERYHHIQHIKKW